MSIIQQHTQPHTHHHNDHQVCRGNAVMLIAPTSGTEEIANPFFKEEGAAA